MIICIKKLSKSLLCEYTILIIQHFLLFNQVNNEVLVLQSLKSKTISKGSYYPIKFPIFNKHKSYLRCLNSTYFKNHCWNFKQPYPFTPTSTIV